MAAEIFGGGMHDHIRAMFQGPLQDRRGEGVVDGDRGPGLMGDAGDAR